MSEQVHWRPTESARTKGVEVKQRVEMSSNTSPPHRQVYLLDKELDLDEGGREGGGC